MFIFPLHLSEKEFFYYGCLGDFFFSTSALNKLKHVDGNFQDFNAFVDAGASSQALLDDPIFGEFSLNKCFLLVT